MSELNAEERREIGRALKHEATIRFGPNWRNPPKKGGPEESELRQIFIDYNNGELQSEPAREIILNLNSNMAYAY